MGGQGKHLWQPEIGPRLEGIKGISLVVPSRRASGAENLPTEDVPGVPEDGGGQCGCAGGNREGMRRESVSFPRGPLLEGWPEQ